MCQQLANEHLRMHSPHRADGGGLVNRHRSGTGVVKHADVVGETMIHHRRCHAATGAITRGGVFGLADSAERQVSTMPASRSMIVLGSDSTVPVSCCGGVQCVAMTPCRYSASTAASDDCDSVRRTLTAQSRCGPNPLTLASALDNSARAPHSASLRTIGASVGSVSDKSARWSGSFTDSSVRRGSSSSSDVSRHAASCAASSVDRAMRVRTMSGIDASSAARQARSSPGRPSARWAARLTIMLRSSVAARRPPIAMRASTSRVMRTST